ncbi:MAG: dipicolinate synthase subunit B [Clostridia bacterium]|nr:dipicolinate synthase subunit B [Clostridia bacterium]
MIGYAFCGSFCTLKRSLDVFERMVKGGMDILPIVSENVFGTDTRFWRAADFCARLSAVSGRAPIHSIVDAEPLGPKIKLDALIISPCTGNTLSKMAAGITDTAVTMAAKAHLRADRKLIIALASNDAMSANLKNIATMLMRKQVYFVPMIQDDPESKPHSLVADFSLLEETLSDALSDRQKRKLFL